MQRSKSAPLVTVGIPVLNGEKWIRRALNSILAQEYSNLEIIISDNASADGTYSICIEYAKQYKNISIIRQDRLVPINDNFMAVLNAAGGKYFMWAAVDDNWHPTFIRKLVAKLESDSSFAVAQSATLNVSERDFSEIQYVRFTGKNHPETCSSLQLTKRLVSPLKYNYYIYGLFRKDVLLSAYRYFPGIPSSDRWFLLQLPLAGHRFAYVDEPLFIRTIVEKPIYERYPAEAYAQKFRNEERKWFRFDALPVVYDMLVRSEMVPANRRHAIYVVLLQVLAERIKLGFILMAKQAVHRVLLPASYRVFPEALIQSLLNKRRDRIRSKNLKY